MTSPFKKPADKLTPKKRFLDRLFDNGFRIVEEPEKKNLEKEERPKIQK